MVVLHCVARQDSMVGTLSQSITLDILNSCELNCDMIFSSKRIRYKIKKMKIETGYVLFISQSEHPVSRWCAHVNNIGICWIKDVNSGQLHPVNLPHR